MKRALYPGESPEVEETGRKEGTTRAASPPPPASIVYFFFLFKCRNCTHKQPTFSLPLPACVHMGNAAAHCDSQRRKRPPKKHGLKISKEGTLNFCGRRPFSPKKEKGRAPVGGREIIGPIKLEGYYKRAVISLAISFPSPFFDLATACRKV